MPFPISIRGVVRFERLDAKALMTTLVSALLHHSARDLDIEPTRVRFRAGFFRAVERSNVLAPIAHGTLELIPDGTGGVEVRYELSTVQLMIVSMLMSFAMFVFMCTSGAPRTLRFGFSIGCFFWLCGANYVITTVRFPSFLKREAKHAQK